MQVESVKAAAAGRETELSSKLEEHVQQVCDRDMLKEQVQQLQNELQLAQTALSKQVCH